MKTQRLLSGLVTIAALLVPMAASAYLLPEEVLLGDELYAPPNAREGRSQVERQAEISGARRQQEQDAAFLLQHPPEPEIEEPEHTSAPEEGGYRQLTEADMELLRTIRILERVDARQEILSLTDLSTLHTGAPTPLSPTGAPGVLSALTMLGAVGWTMRRAGKKIGWTRSKR